MAMSGELKLYNSMTKTLELFKPIEPGKVGMYVCGVTPYDFSHLGHARAAVCFDVLYRYLKYLGYDVTYVRNFTDIDDKIIRRAHETGEEDPFSLSDRFCKNYLEDMDDLQCLRPTHEPRVSNHMKQITDMITQIKNNGYAYDVDGDVYFAVKKAKNYGVLSGQKLEELKPGERIAVDLRKDHPADFALWKAAKPGEPSWDWESQTWESSVNRAGTGPAPGRPGWHIECSAMSAQYLTHKFDIHGGGRDLIFPHHENEIAQSCAACQDSHVNYWMHNGHVTNNNVKMSKSLGNFFTIREITKRYHPLALRHFLISADYRSPLNYTVTQLEHSSDAVFKIYQALENCKDALSLSQDATTEDKKGNAKPAQVTPAAQNCISKLHADFLSRLSEDLSTSHILIGTCFQDALTLINTYCKSLQKKMQKQLKLSTMQSLVELEEQVKEVLDILGLLSPLAYSEVLQQLKGMALKRAGMKEDELSRLIAKRGEAKIVRDYETSDKIRADLETKGVALMDNDARIWRPCIPAEQKQQLPQESA